MLLLIFLLLTLRGVRKARNRIWLYAKEPAFRRSSVPARLLPLLTAALLATGVLLYAEHMATPEVRLEPYTYETGEAETRARLRSMGFPENLLRDLPDGEVKKLEGTVAVWTQTREYKTFRAVMAYCRIGENRGRVCMSCEDLSNGRYTETVQFGNSSFAALVDIWDEDSDRTLLLLCDDALGAYSAEPVYSRENAQLRSGGPVWEQVEFRLMRDKSRERALFFMNVAESRYSYSLTMSVARQNRVYRSPWKPYNIDVYDISDSVTEKISENIKRMENSVFKGMNFSFFPDFQQMQS